MKSVLVLVTILFVILLSAGMDRVVGWAFKLPSMKNEYYKNRSIRQKDYKPGKVRFVSRNAEDSPIKYRLAIDKLGYIEPSSIHEHPDVKVVFLGGSTTECRFMDEEKRFPYLVGRELERISGKTINSYNAGVSGNNSTHSINLLYNKILRLEPNIVVMMHNINDLIVLAYTGTYWNDNQYRSATVDERILIDSPPTITGIVGDSLRWLYPHISFGLESNLLHTKPEKDEWSEIRGKRLDLDESSIEEQFRKNLETFVAVSKANRVIPVLMTQFNRFGDEEIKRQVESVVGQQGIAVEEYIALYQRMNQVIREVAIAQDVVLIDLGDTIPKSPEFMYDSVHLTPAGSQRVSNHIVKHLEAIVSHDEQEQQAISF